MKTCYKYIYFVEVPNHGRTTKFFHGRNNKMDLCLGVIRWDRGWRQYCFYPNAETMFSKGCLEDVNDFIGQLMDERKKS